MEAKATGEKVYLAGAISGLSYADSMGWREEVAEQLTELGYDVYSPMRHKRHLKEKFGDQVLPHTSSAFRDPFARDTLDIKRADFIIANMVEAPGIGPSVGTLVELGLAYGLGKHIIVVDERLDDHNDQLYTGRPDFKMHPFISGVATDIVPSLKEAVALLAEYRPLAAEELVGTRGY